VGDRKTRAYQITKHRFGYERTLFEAEEGTWAEPSWRDRAAYHKAQLKRLHAEQERRYPRGDLEPLTAGVFDEIIAAIIAALESQSEPPPPTAT
jgi:hypothetical protein